MRKQLHSHAFLKQLLIMKLLQKSLHLDGLSKYSSLFFIAFILWAVGRGQNPLDTRYMNLMAQKYKFLLESSCYDYFPKQFISTTREAI